MNKTIVLLLLTLFTEGETAAAQQPTELFLRGHSVIPAPQKVA
jgi:hypothetical protein